jgi:hypothetical protein
MTNYTVLPYIGLLIVYLINPEVVGYLLILHICLYMIFNFTLFSPIKNFLEKAR